jgi:hypothetical protein
MRFPYHSHELLPTLNLKVRTSQRQRQHAVTDPIHESIRRLSARRADGLRSRLFVGQHSIVGRGEVNRSLAALAFGMHWLSVPKFSFHQADPNRLYIAIGGRQNQTLFRIKPFIDQPHGRSSGRRHFGGGNCAVGGRVGRRRRPTTRPEE